MSDPAEKPGPFVSLRTGNFRFLLGGAFLTNGVLWIQQVTLSWLVYDLTGSGTMLGSINLIRSIAILGMIPLVGVLIDRLNRRNLILATSVWLFIISAALTALLFFDRAHIVHLFIFAFLAGIAQRLDTTLRQVVTFDLVPRYAAPNAVALLQTSWSIMRSFGPSIGGFLLLWCGAAGNFSAQTGVYVLVAITTLCIHFPEQKIEVAEGSAIQNIKEGIQFVVKNRVTAMFMLIGFVMPLFIIPIFAILPPVYAVEVFNGGPDVLGLLLSFAGVGGIFGGIAAAFMGRVERRGLVQIASLVMLGLALLGFGFSTKLSTALPLLVIGGFCEMIFLVNNQTILLMSVPDKLRGRVTSIVNMNNALSSLGGMIAGIGSDLFGGPKPITIILCIIAISIAIFIFMASPTVRQYRLGSSIESPQ